MPGSAQIALIDLFMFTVWQRPCSEELFFTPALGQYAPLCTGIYSSLVKKLGAAKNCYLALEYQKETSDRRRESGKAQKVEENCGGSLKMLYMAVYY